MSRAWLGLGVLATAITACATSHDSSLRLQNCPDVPATFYTCGGYVPGLFGHDMIWVGGGAAPDGISDGKPVGCAVSLPYEDPASPGRPVTCTCVDQGPVAEGHAAWDCTQ